jgi:hypothetical protein
MIQTIAEPLKRAKATAISLLVSNQVGAGLEPLAVSMLSDAYGEADSPRLWNRSEQRPTKKSF